MAEIKAKYLASFKGRLSFHVHDVDAALVEKNKGPFAKSNDTVADVSAYSTILLTAPQYERIKTQLIEFLGECAKLPKGEIKLTPAELKMLVRQIEADEALPLNTPFKQLSEKTLELWPECVAAVKLLSPRGQSFVEEAIVRNEDDLKVPDPDRIGFPLQLPLRESRFTMYNGCWVIAPLSFYTYKNGANPGVSAGGTHIIFQRDDTPFAGGPGVDRDSIFAMDDDED